MQTTPNLTIRNTSNKKEMTKRRYSMIDLEKQKVMSSEFSKMK